ncbi:MAG: hypothetical protein QF566_02540 [Candidatus Thalassarchaeaceae archaeon]|jgi:hypothetical protein|nr:hypothetical protein [Candidatus Thalassarchaeaceae archaeon]|tara:strand:- start:170 stop:868 length:699 start_codon:yes stop_codon:yes gene_type:complete
MHIMTKATLGLGVALLIGSIILAVAGGGSTVSDLAENPNGVEVWSGTAPEIYEGNFEVMNTYLVFVEDGESVDVTVVGGDGDNRFIPCEEEPNDCDYYDWPSHTYVGQVSVYTPGTWEVEFSGTGAIVVTEMVVDIGGAMSILGGMFGFCCSFCVLGLGVIFIFTLKDDKMQQGVMMVQQSDGTFQQVGGMAAPAQGAPMVAGEVHPAYTTQQPIIQQPAQQGGQQPPNQGF